MYITEEINIKKLSPTKNRTRALYLQRPMRFHMTTTSLNNF